MIASILDHFSGTNLDNIAKLTDLQIRELYYHKRTKEGKIDFPDDEILIVPKRETTTLEEELKELAEIAKIFHLTPENIAQATEELRKKFPDAGN